jgi:prolipoprotein diacylglyceryltransferase
MSMLIAFVAGGRLLVIASHLAALAGSPASFFSLNIILFDIWGALAATAIVAGLVILREKLPLWPTLALLVPLFAALGIGLGLSQLASAEAIGGGVDQAHLSWAIQLWGAYRHPTQMYDVIAAVSTLGLIWFWQPYSMPGSGFLLWAALTATSRLIFEGFRGDSTLVFGGVRLAQILAWLVLAAALIGLELLLTRKPRETSTAPDGGGNQRRTALHKCDAP